MGQSALGAHWNKATPRPQRARFLKAADSAEARAYSERFGQYGGQTLTVGKVTTRPNGVFIVDSKLNQSNGQPIKLRMGSPRRRPRPAHHRRQSRGRQHGHD